MSLLFANFTLNIFILEGSNDLTYAFIASLYVLFFLVVGTWYLTRINKKNVILHHKKILGWWIREGVSTTGEAWWFKVYFGENDFEMHGNPSFLQKGNYKIRKEIENLLILDLLKLEGDGDLEKKSLQISLDRKAGTLYIDSREYVKSSAPL